VTTEAQDLAGQIAQLRSQAQQLGAAGVMEIRLAAALLYRQLLTPEQLSELLAQAHTEEIALKDAIQVAGVVSENQMLEAQAVANGVPYVQIDVGSIPQATLSLLKPETARMHHAVPLRLRSAEGRTIVTIALANPASAPARSALEQYFAATQTEVEFVAAHPDAIAQALRGRYDSTIGGDEFEVVQEDEFELDELGDSESAGPARQYYAEIFQEAVAQGASDVHLEVAPDGQGLMARFRVDGVMHDYSVVPERYRRALIAIIKLDMDLDVSDERRLKNGRVTKRVNGHEVDFRGANWVTTRGEEMVVRLLDREGVKLDIQTMGFSEHNIERLTAAYQSSYGSVVICGPTGSGKSSTLYALLNELVSPERTILTIEDPVEFRLAGIQQTQVVTSLGRDFSDSLRNALRCDPDVIMVGEVRDEMTAEISMRAAISGHLLLTTVHAMEASLAPISLIRMGVPAYQVSDALRLVVSQRLVRKLCPNCREIQVPQLADLAALGYDEQTSKNIADSSADYNFYGAHTEGCDECVGGYSGRTVMAEAMTFTDSEKELLMSPDRSALALRRLAIANGMIPLAQDGVSKAATGITSLAEVRRVVA
jgi:type II secretory ATPase GspE/PulE/Tfp pilus assembly ATPase PilB-like protein